MVITVLLVGCADDETPTNYTSANRDAFLTACSQPLDDPRLISEVCGCVYERLEFEMSFDDFVELDEALTPPEVEDDESNPVTPPVTLPDEMTDIVADCFVEEADL